jgi:hypothetical protein
MKEIFLLLEGSDNKEKQTLNESVFKVF